MNGTRIAITMLSGSLPTPTVLEPRPPPIERLGRDPFLLAEGYDPKTATRLVGQSFPPVCLTLLDHY